MTTSRGIVTITLLGAAFLFVMVTIFISSQECSAQEIPRPIIKWIYDTSSTVISRSATSPAIGEDGTIYVGSNSWIDNVHAINPDGSRKWVFDTDGFISHSSPAIDEERKQLYIGTNDGYFYAISLNEGTQVWKVSLEKWTGAYDDDISASPAIGTDGTIYIGTWNQNFYALRPEDGSVKWKFPTSGRVLSSAAIGADGTIYVGCTDLPLGGKPHFYAIEPDGAMKWALPITRSISSSPSIGLDGTIYLGADDGYIYALNPDGSFKWRGQTGWWVRGNPVIGKDNTVYFPSYDGWLYAVNPNGTTKWDFQLTKTPSPNESSPILAADGTIFISNAGGRLRALSPEGRELWFLDLNGKTFFSSPALAEDGTLYIGTIAENKNFYAIDVGSPGLADSAWPMFGQNLSHTWRASRNNPLFLSATTTYSGSETIDSVDKGHKLCRQAFGSGWRWLEFHEQGGWKVSGLWRGEAPIDRGWVWIDDQDAEVYSSKISSGMTWASFARGSNDQGATCHGQTRCDPYDGDTAESQSRPLYCAASDAPLYLAATDPVIGAQVLTSADEGHRRCGESFGSGWRWLEFYEQGGRVVQGTWETEVPQNRGWVWIDDQHAECYSRDTGMTWLATPTGAACDEACNSSFGDTDCHDSRPLICVSDSIPISNDRRKQACGLLGIELFPVFLLPWLNRRRMSCFVSKSPPKTGNSAGRLH